MTKEELEILRDSLMTHSRIALALDIIDRELRLKQLSISLKEPDGPKEKQVEGDLPKEKLPRK